MITLEKNRTLDIQLIPKLDLLNCSKEELYSLLINRYVSNKWWLLDDDTRKQLALKIIKWWSVPLGKIVREKHQVGEKWWEGNPMCAGNAAIRYAIFADSSIARPNEYYQYYYSNEWRELVNEQCFYLPVALGRVYKGTINSMGVSTYSSCHAIAALQVNPNLKQFNSWVFFQYTNPDIRPGDWQIPIHGKVSLTTPIDISVVGWSGPSFVEWET